MRKFSFLFFLVFSLLLYTKIVLAVTFIATVTPTSGEAGKTDQLFNFTINNTGTANVTEVNITLPPNFVLTSFDTSVTGFKTQSSSSYIKWINQTSIGLFDNTSLQYFWVYVTTPPTLGSFNFTLSLNDTNGEINSTNLTILLYDITAPRYSQNITSPSSPTSYSPRKSYWFNISWIDNVAVDKVLLEQNFTTLNPTLANATLSNESSVYYFNITDLPAGLYAFKWYANDTNNTFNSTPQFIYNITKAFNILNVSFNTTQNANITITNASTLIVNVSAIGNITLYRANGAATPVASGQNFIIYDTSTSPLISTNLYNFTAVVDESVNYTTNSSTYFVMVVPSYSVSSSMPSSYSSTESSTFAINFSSAPGIDNLLLELDGNRYAMSNSSLTYYFYSSNLAAGNYSWQILGKYSNHIFNLTSLSTFNIQKASPSLALTAYPGWNVYKGNQTSVSCISPHVSVSLYRNGSAVSNPDVQTLATGDYLYVCSSSETANYSSQAISQYLKVIEVPLYFADLAFTQVENLILVTQNSSNTTIVKVKNTGNLTQTIYLWIENINPKWYSVNASNASLLVNKEVAFLVDFSVGEVEPKDYNGNFKVNSTEKSISSSFTLRVLPSESFKLKIANSLAEYEKNYSSLADEINEMGKEGYNITLAQQKLNELKALLDQAKGYVSKGEYSSAYNLFENIRTLIGKTTVEISEARQKGKIQTFLPQFWLYIIIGIIITGICIFLAYLFWPTKEVIPTEVKMPIKAEEKESLLEKIKKFFRIKKTSYHYGVG